MNNQSFYWKSKGTHEPSQKILPTYSRPTHSPLLSGVTPAVLILQTGERKNKVFNVQVLTRDGWLRIANGFVVRQYNDAFPPHM
jgi:hypothetical protein